MVSTASLAIRAVRRISFAIEPRIAGPRIVFNAGCVSPLDARKRIALCSQDRAQEPDRSPRHRQPQGGDTCKPVVNRLDSILATCASHRSAAIQGKRGAVATELHLHSCGVQPRSTAPSSNNCARPKTSAPGVPRVTYTRHLHADQSHWRQPVRFMLQRCPRQAAAPLRQSRRHYRGASR